MRGILFLLVLVCLLTVASVQAQKVDERASNAIVDGTTVVVTLAIDNDFGLRSADARVDLITTDDAVIASDSRSLANLARGKQSIEFRLPIAAAVKGERKNDDIAWYRLRYRIGNAIGIVSLSQILRDLFELKIAADGSLMAGMTYRARIRATNPFTQAPAAGVKVETVLELEVAGEAKKIELRGIAETDAEGFAVVDFEIPVETKLDGDAELKVTGSRKGLTRVASDELSTLEDDVQVLMMTDKPIYQPGQGLNIRAIVLKGGEAKTILAGTPIEFRIEDQDDTLLYREKLTSSPFGVAAITWRIPSNAKLGDYQITIRDEDGDQIGGQRVKVSRYDLPNFAVVAKPNRDFYIPSDKTAEIEIRADYLFGRPVTKGKVRVVEEESREWNWKEQKYDIDEGEVREGETDSTGKFHATFDLAEAHDDLKDDRWRLYRDKRFAAYFTDATTNKTEQRRFDIRISKHPIHVYLIRGSDFGNSRLPLYGYVSTFYADGTPAQCTVDLKASVEDEDKFRSVATVKTNSFGVAKVAMPRPKIGDPDDDLDFVVVARDKTGKRGVGASDTVRFNDDDEGIRVTTDRTIYKPGEPVTIKIISTVATGTVYVDLVKGWSVVDSHFATLKEGKAELTVPYKDAFKGEMKVTAFVEDPDDEDDVVSASRGIIFPSKAGINIDASFDKAVYKPNDEATLKFNVVDVVGKSIESALGVVILDKAVEERARTDSEFGSMFRGLEGWLGYGASFAGVNVKDLNELDLTKPISEEMQLVAEVVLHDTYYNPHLFNSERYHAEAKTVFGPSIDKQLEGMRAALTDTYRRQNFLHPTDGESLRTILAKNGVDFDAMRDPWSTPFNVAYSVNRQKDVVSISSAGPDKKFGTNDDFEVFNQMFDYFTPMGWAIDTVVRNYHARTGEFLRDDKTLYRELGIRDLRDRFGTPYKMIVSAEGRYIQLRFKSAGPDRTFSKYEWSGDDFDVWTNRTDYFTSLEDRIRNIQSGLSKAPMDVVEFKSTLKKGGLDLDGVRDANGYPLQVQVQLKSRYWNNVRMESVQVFGETKRTERRIVTPVTQKIVEFTIRTVGNDGKAGTWDDVTLTQVVHVLSEQSVKDPAPVSSVKPASFVSAPNGGSIAGTIKDMQGAAVPNATIKAINAETLQERSTTSDSDGRFLIMNLVAGTYSVRVISSGFRQSVVENIKVVAGAIASVDVELSVAGVSEVVTVTAEAASVDTTNASVSTITSSQIMGLPINGGRAAALLALQPGVRAVTKSGSSEDDSQTDQQRSTPRLREYFPETLLWQPEVITDAMGRAEVKFRMADNITTWKMYTIASTKNGKIGFAEKEAAAFQSFFVDLDPPKFLTTGDEIYLPTQVRNYTETKQNVSVTMARSDWFNFLDAETKQIGVDSGGSENAVFGFKATTPVKEGKQRVTALAEKDSDAIERPVTVRPDGREIVRTESRYLTGKGKFEIDIPATAIPNSASAELKLYPNLMAHVAEAVEGLVKRPYGCGEQTISSTYPNLMILKFADVGEGKARRISATVERTARKYLQSGYERLLGYQVADGGFSYWGGKDSADFALTAYALRFLADASQFIEVDPNAVKRAEDWLVKQQHADGTWTKRHSWETVEDPARAKATTTYVARVLAMLQAANKSAQKNEMSVALTKALSYLRVRNTELDDPYSLSLLGLAALDAGDEALARSIADRLIGLAKDEDGGAYWNLESNTAFNGWGTAGRIETTALVTQLLTRLGADRDLVGRAMVFLLKNKDRYGVWYSTQTTINVLDAFVTMMAEDRSGAQQVHVIVNGQAIETIDIAPDKIEQIAIDLTGKLNLTKDTVELRSSERTPLMANVVMTHFVDWRDADASGRSANGSRALRLDYKCDRTDAAIMQEISCSVTAERIAYRGYGMLLAEIGTPPGADVSRESLQDAMTNDGSISRYDILSDRIILYMWARPGGTKLNFKFRPRYGINAQTPASVVYDYYNPEAQAVNAPLRFAVR